ncbi:SusD family protein [compost metagenome]
MKYDLFKYIFLGIAILQLSCKRFVGIDPPKTSLVNETVFQTNDQATAAITGIYATLRSTNFASGNINGIASCAGLSSDELISYLAAYLPFNENQLTPETPNGLSTLYSGPYQSIFTANSIIENLQASNGVTPLVKEQLQGEALFIRAFAHFYLVNLFGKIPLQLSSDNSITSIAAKASIDQVYQQIVNDLKSAEAKLQENYPTPGRVRPNKSAAQALLARVYLYVQDWENAEKYASLIISKTSTYNLVDFNDVFLANSREAIWQLEPPPNSGALEGAFFIPGSLLIPPGNVSLRNSFIQNAFEVGDKRKDAWVRSYTIPAGTYYYPFKYKIRSATTATEYSMVLRFAEQYLIRAEARINQEKTELGIGDLNIIRKRQLLTGTNANTLSPLPTNLAKPDALLAVEQERKVELFSEWGHRWFDLKRTGRATAVFSLIKPLWEPTDVLYPIPQLEIDRNKNIKPQNDGY